MQLNSKLKGSTLGSAAEVEEDDTLAWIKKSKKKAKQLAKEMALAKKREDELAERDQEAYDERE